VNQDADSGPQFEWPELLDEACVSCFQAEQLFVHSHSATRMLAACHAAPHRERRKE
jgi:hypothetical protein